VLQRAKDEGNDGGRQELHAGSTIGTNVPLPSDADDRLPNSTLEADATGCRPRISQQKKKTGSEKKGVDETSLMRVK